VSLTFRLVFSSSLNEGARHKRRKGRDRCSRDDLRSSRSARWTVKGIDSLDRIEKAVAVTY